MKASVETTEARAQREDDNPHREPTSAKPPWIRRVRIVGGYLDGPDQELHPGGNVVIGEHGAGKSTLFALLRLALAIPVPPQCPLRAPRRSPPASRRTSGPVASG